MASVMEEYRELRRQLEYLRWTSLGHESQEEDDLLDRMDRVWERLTADEIVLLESDPPIIAPIHPVGRVRELVDVDVQADDQPPRVLKEVA